MLTIPAILQATDYDCGAAALDAVAEFWGLRKRGPVRLANPIQGMAPDAVEAVLRSLGLSVLSGTMTVGDLRHLTATGRPVLCPVALAGGHWVVVRGVARGSVHFHCPTTGPSKMREAEWLVDWRDNSRSGHWFDRWGICPAR